MVEMAIENVGRIAGRMQERRPLDADLYERESEFLAIFDAPGAHREDVQVSFEDGSVRVRVDRFRDFHEGFEMRYPGRGMRLEGETALPERAGVEIREATATLTDSGTLQIRLPKTETSVPIEESVGSDDA